MARKSTNGHAAANDIAAIEREIGQLMRDIETRVGRLQELTKRGASDATDYVTDTLSDAAGRVRNGAQHLTDEAARMGGDAMHRVEEEIGQRPLLTMAIAAGIGYLAGMAGRRH
jgi:ElaB/YqjD/DUF883 family membrane-anchored ribosome-binding protein